MNPTDPFEEEMRRQTFRSIPPDWKNTILPHVDSKPEFSWNQFWSTLFFPYRHAYAALALVWVGIILFHLDTPAPSNETDSVALILSPGTDPWTPWQDKQRFLALAGANPFALEYLIR